MLSRATNSLFPNGSAHSWEFHDNDFSSSTKDLVLTQQMSQHDIFRIEPHMLVTARVCDEDHTASKPHKSLLSLSILSPQTHHLQPQHISGSSLASKIAIISRSKLQLLVTVLFWWETEISRYNDAEAKKQQFQKTIDESMAGVDRETREERIREGVGSITALQREMPSQRAERGKGDEEDLVLPVHEPMISRQDYTEEVMPPAYSQTND